MKLSELLKGLDYCVRGSINVDIKGITYDSRLVRKGYIFVALRGKNSDGNEYIKSALKSGASLIVSEELTEYKGNWIITKEPLAALASLSSAFYGHPDKKLLVTGITGTNGKTTITYFLESIFKAARLRPGVIGTVNYRYANQLITAVNTTPQSSDVYALLSGMSKARCRSAILEVSSHALALNRVDGIEFDIGVFTNLTRDHLDFHGGMDEYFNAKKKLFESLRPGQKKYRKYAIINADDSYGAQLIKQMRNAFETPAQALSYSIKKKADIRAENVKANHDGSDFALVLPGSKHRVRLHHLGKHNIYNALAAAGSAFAAGVKPELIVSGLQSAPVVPGRLQRVKSDKPYTVVVDFAHTDDALLNVLTALRQLKPSRIITLFGCGGDRDRSKRPIMGALAAKLSDFVFVTSDNPRTEDPEKILLDIEVGIRRENMSNYTVIVDREQAIASAISMARKGDIILLAGKGHETYQIIGTQRIHFNDAETASKYLNP